MTGELRFASDSPWDAQDSLQPRRAKVLSTLKLRKKGSGPGCCY
jgi:hypothetical protein